MADDQAAGNSGNGQDPNANKKTLSQGVQLLPLLIKYFKSVGFLLGVWVLGYFRFSSTWVMVGLLCHMLNEEYKKIKESKKKFAQAAVKNEKEAILARCEDLPSWVYFPDIERAEWLNKTLRQMWPYIGQYTKNLLETSVTASVQNSLPNSLKPFKFEHIDLGDVPPRIGGVKVYVDNVKRDEIFLDMEIFFASDTEIKMTARGMAAGIKDLQIHGTIRVVMKPLVPVVPFIGGVSVFFLNQPTVDFDLTQLANMLDMPLLSNSLRSIIVEQVNHLMVLPNKLTFPLVENVDLTSLRYPLPAGVIRFHLVAARDLKAADIGIGKRGKSDPYVKLYVGTKIFKTRVIKDNINPVWNQFYEAVVEYKHGQYAEIDVLDEDTGEDDELGTCSVDIQNVASLGQIDSWLPLENVKTGMLHLRATWMHLSKDPADLDRSVVSNKAEKRDTGSDEYLSSALLIVTLDSAKNLPRSKKSMSEPQAYAKVSVGHDTQETLPSPVRTVNPKWETNFQFLLSDPRNQDLTIQLCNSAKHDRPLGFAMFPVKTLLTAKNMTSEQELPLKDAAENSMIRLRLCLRILTATQPADWATDTVHEKKEAKTADPADEGSSVDPSSGQASPSSAPAPTSPASSTSPAPAAGPSTPAPSPAPSPVASPPVPTTPVQPAVEEVLLKDSAPKTSAVESGLRQRAVTTTSTTSSEGSLGRIQLTIRYSQPRGKLVVCVHKCVNLVGYDEDNLSDPYVRLILVPGKDKKKTQVVKNDLNPIYDETFDWSVSLQEAQSRSIEVSVKNKNSMFSKAKTHMGVVTINLANMDLAQAHTEWYNLEDPPEDD